MQINLLNPKVKETVKILGWPLFIILLCFNLYSNKSTVTTKVVIPEFKGVFESKKPDQKPLEWPEKGLEKPTIKWNNQVIKVENPINIDLANQYVRAKDSIERLNLYIKSIQLNRFSSKFEDENLLLNIDGIVQGEIQEITPSYTIKPKEVPVEIKQKETYLRMWIGASLGINKELDRGVYKFDIDFQNKKGDIFSGEYMRVNGQDFGLVGIKKSILNLKR